ncbi:MAG: S1 RNA-binding domain-containing protein [Clostridia bacterium]|nr:S1 RNA-binding domain-containing protein [Clostridia bacterium]
MSFEVGSVIDGKVTGITKFGAFVEIAPGVNGMVHISEIASTYVSEIRDYLKEGQDVKVKVITVGDDGKIGLSIKKAQPSSQPEKAPLSSGGRRHQNITNARSSSEPVRPADVDWGEKNKQPSSFEDMLNKFKQNSSDKMSGMKQRPAETRRSGGYGSRKNFTPRPDDY